MCRKIPGTITPGEAALLLLVVYDRPKHKIVGPMIDEIAECIGMHPKRCQSFLERWMDNRTRWIEKEGAEIASCILAALMFNTDWSIDVNAILKRAKKVWLNQKRLT
jgi:hypothetical protein